MRRLFTLLSTLLIIYPALAQQVNESAYERYINKANFDQMIPGYYIQGNKTTETTIKCQSPVDLQDQDNDFIIDKGKGGRETS